MESDQEKAIGTEPLAEGSRGDAGRYVIHRVELGEGKTKPLGEIMPKILYFMDREMTYRD